MKTCSSLEKPSTTSISGNQHIRLHNPIDQQKLVSGTRFNWRKKTMYLKCKCRHRLSYYRKVQGHTYYVAHLLYNCLGSQCCTPMNCIHTKLSILSFHEVSKVNSFKVFKMVAVKSWRLFLETILLVYILSRIFFVPYLVWQQIDCKPIENTHSDTMVFSIKY